MINNFNVKHIGRDTIVFDIDGTLSDCSHRHHHAQAGDWDTFNELCHLDKLKLDVAHLARYTYSNGNPLHKIIVTARRDTYKLLTLKWLQDNNVDHCFDAIFMRTEPDYWLKSEDYKQKIVEPFKDHILFALEDNERVVQRYRDMGISTFQVSAGGVY